MSTEAVVDRPPVMDFVARPGERFLGALPSGIRVYIADYAADSVSKKDMLIMRAEQAKIAALGDPTLQLEGFRSQSRILRDFSENSTSYVAIENLYTLARSGAARLRNRLGGIPDEGFFRDVKVAEMWFRNFNNAAAVRERGTIIEESIVNAGRKTHEEDPGGIVRIGSIACGSSRPVLRAMQRLKAEGIAATGVMLDSDRDALAYTSELAGQLGLGNDIQVVEDNVLFLSKPELSPESFDVIEAGGIDDYLRGTICRKFFTKIFKMLKPDGMFVSSNIIHNDEEVFLHEAVGWKLMHYRTPEEFSNLFIDPLVGFKPEDCRAYLTPNKLYTVVVAQKAREALRLAA